MIIQGKLVSLIPMTAEDKAEFYSLATTSDGAERWYGKDIPSHEDFFKDWNDDYFDSSKPKLGQCYWIKVENNKIGQINYNAIDEKNKKVELDIIIGSKNDMGKGYGSDALRTLIAHLFNNFNLNKIYVFARLDNSAALNTYSKVGFVQEGVLRQDEWFNGKFIDRVTFGMLRSEIKR